jgi:hypothetical protein
VNQNSRERERERERETERDRENFEQSAKLQRTLNMKRNYPMCIAIILVLDVLSGPYPLTGQSAYKQSALHCIHLTPKLL